jgi:hypothetical protein
MKKLVNVHFGFTAAFAAALVVFASQSSEAQTCDVTWRKADNPRVISGTVTIPANQTVCAQPGVMVQFSSNGKLNLFGRINAIGTPAERITFTGGNVSPNRVEVVGTMELRYANISVPLNVNPGGSLLVRDSSFTARGAVFTLDGIVFSYTPKFVLVEKSSFNSNEKFNSDNAAFYVSDAAIVFRHNTVSNAAYCDIGKSNLLIDAVSFQNARFEGMKITQDVWQPQFLNNLSITGAASIGLSLELGNFEIGPNVTIQGNRTPIKANGGLLPGSSVPTAGNANNFIEIGGMQPHSVYAPFAIPYVVGGARISQTEILPGATLKMMPNVKIDTFGNPHAEVLGLPTARVTFEPFLPGQKWNGLEFHQSGDRMEYVTLDGSTQGLYGSDFGGSAWWLDQVVFRNHDVAINRAQFDLFHIQGSLITNNTIGVRADGNGSTHRMSGETNPNLFENNTLAVRSINGAITDVRFNWWNSPTGPTTPLNPGGSGDRIEGNPQFQPYRTVRPDTSDHPPVVRLQRRPFLLTAGSFEGVVEPGQRVILRWDAFDNAQIAKHKILFSFNSNFKDSFTIVADNLPGSTRSYEFTMPANAGTQGSFQKVIRIVAVDDRGQEGWDEWQIQVPTGTEPGVLQITNPAGGQTLRAGSELNVSWTITTPFNDPTFQVFLILDGHRKVSFQANGGNAGPFSSVKLPYISTDSARIAVKSQGSVNNVKWFYSEPFAIRPDARYPDAPPSVTLTSPAAGQTFTTGSVVPITWSASDDEALRSFTILYSTDGGRTWLTLVENLPPTETGYDWQTPQGTGFSDVRVRVVALDRRFQNSSTGADRSFSVVQAPPVPTAIVSRKLHNGAPYDIDLPLNGSGVECRASGGTHQVIFTFASPVSVSSASIEGSGAVNSFTAEGANVLVNLSGVADAQMITIRLNGVSNGSASANVSLRMGTLLGDRNGDRTVNVSDALQTRNQSGEATNAGNFRSDMNADGVVNSGDTTIARSRSGAFLGP